MPEKYRLLNKEEQKAIAEEIKAGDKKAIEKLFLHNQRLAHSIANNYYIPSYVSFEDVLQEAYLALYKAVLTYDNSRDIAFSTYATTVIKNTVWNYLMETISSFHIPRNIASKMVKMKLYCEKYEYLYQKEPSDEEIANEIGIDIDTVSSYKQRLEVMNSTVNIDSIYSVPNNSFLEYEKIEIHELLNILDDEEKKVIEYRFGFINDECLTLEQIANKLHCCREKVRCLQNTAITKLRKSLLVT